MIRVLLSVVMAASFAMPLWTQTKTKADDARTWGFISEGKEAWFSLFMAGERVGRACEKTAVEKLNGVERIVVREEMHLKFAADGESSVMQSKMLTVFEVTPPHKFVRFVEISHEGENRSRCEVSVKGENLRCHETENGTEHVRLIKALGPTLGEYAPQYLLSEHPVGTKRELKSFSLQDRKIKTSIFEVLGDQSTGIPGEPKPQKARRIRKTDVEKSGSEEYIVSRKWGMHGVSAFSGAMEGRRVSAADAKKEVEGRDPFAASVIAIDKPLGAHHESHAFTTIVPKGLLPFLASRSTQVLIDLDVAIVTVGYWGRKGPAVSEAERKLALEESSSFPKSHPKVNALAQKALKGAKTDEEKARQLVAFVSEFIVDADVTAEAGVLGLLEKPRGDCSCHSCVFVTMARAAGIAAREVSGWIYMGDEAQTFGAHAWCEIEIDGRWHEVDPSWNEFIPNPFRVRTRGNEGLFFRDEAGKAPRFRLVSATAFPKESKRDR